MYNDEEDDEMEDEVAMSPEPEDGGLDGNGQVITGEELQTTNGIYRLLIEVDGDRENPLPFVGQDSGSTGGVHAAILSAANAGSGYMLFAQQKRQEAEEKRSTERKERRS